MSNLIQLRNQVKSIQATLKMTQAIRLVSMSMYSRLERRQVALRTYLDRYTKTLGIFFNSTMEINHPLLQVTPNNKKLFVIVATNRGLCGSLNTNLFRHFEQANTREDSKQACFITIGQKAKKYVIDNGFKEIICSYNELNGENYRSLTNDLIDRIFLSKTTYSSITFYSSYLRGFFKQQPRTTQLTPLIENTALNQEEIFAKKPLQESEAPEDDIATWTWEQPHQEIFDFLISSYLKTHISNLLYDSLLAEHAARFFAMDNSTTNANKLLEDLSLLYNKQRQMIITKEVAELSSVIPQHR